MEQVLSCIVVLRLIIAVIALVITHVGCHPLGSYLHKMIVVCLLRIYYNKPS